MNKSERILTGAELLWECLIQEGVEVVFGYPGGANLPIYDTLTAYRDRVRHVLVRHEQGAAHMADGYARVSGKVGVAMATSGPGATNLVTGIATAMMDSSPMVCITGQVAATALGGDAFQETDITGATLPLTKHSYLVMNVEELAETFREAFYIARTGRPGPVLIDIPKDVQNARTAFNYSAEPINLPGYHPPEKASDEAVTTALDMINNAEQPVILAGHGILMSHAMEDVVELMEQASVPATPTLLGLGTIPASHPLNLGMMGMHGTACANHAIQEADLLIACGMRFDDRVTGKLATYSPHSKKIHIDIDASELNKNVRVDLAINADLATVLRQINPGIRKRKREAWVTKIAEWQKDASQRDILQMDSPVLMGGQVIRTIWEGTPEDAVIVSDVGQHQMLTAQYYAHEHPHTFITSGGLGTMGFSLPAAIGASFHVKDKEIWVIVGDGGFQMNVQELGPAVQEGANINIAIINNGYLGMVRQWQQLFYEARYTETPISSPDYVKLAEAYGLPGYRVERREDIPSAMDSARSHQGPALIDFVVEKHDMVFPMVPAGASLHEMIRRPHPKHATIEVGK
ncbi:MAG: biosynthetic-type acetolactate synthase large subunit [Fidelibacterota bacterium]|nr:MAG: biosynthetic-type acetolactate synthase large subunit [Candidatus Neomarinimicrobiota bacterium]